jgi:thioesterase domain-containing protein
MPRRTADANCAGPIPDVKLHRVGGDHYSMLQPPHVGEMADVISEVLAQPTA